MFSMVRAHARRSSFCLLLLVLLVLSVSCSHKNSESPATAPVVTFIGWGPGSTFKIYLPRVDEPALVAAETAQSAVESGAETVLLVEDEPSLRDLIKIALSGNGFTVLDVGNPADAITVCREHTAPLHLLLTDVIMPGMDGPALAKQVQKERPDIKVLYMSGYATNFIMHDGAVDSGTNFLEKPFHPRALLHRVREVLDSAGRRGSA